MKETRVGHHSIVFIEGAGISISIVVLNKILVIADQATDPGCCLHLGKNGLNQTRQTGRAAVEADIPAVCNFFRAYLVESVDMRMIRVIAVLMPDIQSDEHTTAEPYREAKDIDQREGSIPVQAAPGYFEIVEEHKRRLD